nr:MAG TPA: hypothetical protein [Crassvirales sp.]
MPSELTKAQDLKGSPLSLLTKGATFILPCALAKESKDQEFLIPTFCAVLAIINYPFQDYCIN